MKTLGVTLLVVLALGCSGDETDKNPPDRDPGEPAELEPGRRVRRLTADQFHRSLQVATGQSWSQFDEFSAALGKADFAEITDEGTELSVTFDKLVHDAAREACKNAVAADRAGGDTILRHASVSDRGQPELIANLQYLSLRFLGFKVDTDDDPRITPWLSLLTDGDISAVSDDDMALRWEAVCIGFATHPDFLTY
jgi:hypothetical protein